MSSAVSPALGGTFRCVIPVRWGDLDALNHVNNTVYLRYVEEARVRLYALLGRPVPADKVAILAHLDCDFLKPLLYPADAVVVLTLSRLGRSSMDLDFVIERADEPGVAYARGKNVTVNTLSATGASCPWSEADLAAYARCLTPP